MFGTRGGGNTVRWLSWKKNIPRQKQWKSDEPVSDTDYFSFIKNSNTQHRFFSFSWGKNPHTLEWIKAWRDDKKKSSVLKASLWFTCLLNSGSSSALFGLSSQRFTRTGGHTKNRTVKSGCGTVAISVNWGSRTNLVQSQWSEPKTRISETQLWIPICWVTFSQSHNLREKWSLNKYINLWVTNTFEVL